MPVSKSLRRGILFIERALVATLRNTTTRHILLLLAMFLATTTLLAANINLDEVDFTPGQISPQDVIAPHNATLIDEARTAELKKQAAAGVQKVYQEDTMALNMMQRSSSTFYRQVTEIQSNPGLNDEQRLEALRQLVRRELSNDPKALEGIETSTFLTLLQADEQEMAMLNSETNRIAEVLMARPLKEEDLAQMREQARVEARRLNVGEDYKKWITLVLQSTLRPTMNLNDAATNRLIEEAQNQVMPVQRSIKQGQVLLRKGDPVSEADIEVLKQMGIQRNKPFWITLSGISMLVLTLIGISMIFLRRYQPQVYRQEKTMILLGLLFIITLVVAKVFFAISFSNRPELSSTVGFLIPSAAGSMLMAILIGPRIGIFGTVMIGILIGVITGLQNVAFLVVALVSGLVGVYSVSRVNQGWDLAKGGILIGGINTVVVIAFGLMSNDTNLAWVVWGSVYGILNGLLSAVLTTGLLPYLETTFGITSSIRLLELGNPNHPLIKRLMMEAPGTYHHSIVVGNLAEAAAEVIGAESLLVRVGAYYHDIGKLKRPYFFIENQHTKVNPHDKISPNLSSLIITSHVKDGLEMAREHRLPQVLVDIIYQHHGSSLVAYFYHRALENSQSEGVEESSYRYDAPKPQTKEAALVMLADSVEAAVRSIQKPTPGRIEGLVRRIIKDRLNDGQLEESDLTFKDLDLIAGAFMKILNGIYHSRVEYPDNMTKEALKEIERRKAKNATAPSV
ncbi:MAG: HDIG domain-containing protein [Firmicutes bacterium]|nr:HDIG domain-containing protein [Bacillota bacterium]